MNMQWSILSNSDFDTTATSLFCRVDEAAGECCIEVVFVILYVYIFSEVSHVLVDLSFNVW